MISIPFNRPLYTGKEDVHVLDAMKSHKMSGDSRYSVMCQEWFEKKQEAKKSGEPYTKERREYEAVKRLEKT